MLWKRLSSSLRFGFAEGAQQSVPGHKAPSITDKPAGRYASSLFSAASKNECLQTVLEDMSHLQQLIKSQENFKVLLKNASIKRKQFREIFELFAPQNYHPTTVNLINSLTEAGRLNQLEDIIEIYINYCKILNKEQDIKIISAVQLKPEEKEKVVQAIKKGKPGMKFVVSYEVQPSILGGLQVYADREFLDCSLRSRMERLKTEISKIS